MYMLHALFFLATASIYYFLVRLLYREQVDYMINKLPRTDKAEEEVSSVL
jgi:hypothetical protein